MGPNGDENEGHDPLKVDVTFEDDLREVEASVHAYLEQQGVTERAGLMASLEQLDLRIASSEAFDSANSVGFAFGSAPRIAIVGETRDSPVVEEILPVEFQAQTSLVRAAKDELRASSPAALDALRAAAVALTEARG